MSDMTRGSFLKGLTTLLAGGAATAAAAEACAPEPALALQAAPQDTIEVPVHYMDRGRVVSGVVVYTTAGEVLQNTAGLTPGQCARLWRNAQTLRRSYQPSLGEPVTRLECPRCGRSVGVTKGGKVAKHRPLKEARLGVDACPGSGGFVQKRRAS